MLGHQRQSEHRHKTGILFRKLLVLVVKENAEQGKQDRHIVKLIMQSRNDNRNRIDKEHNCFPKRIPSCNKSGDGQVRNCKDRNDQNSENRHPLMRPYLSQPIKSPLDHKENGAVIVSHSISIYIL